MFVGVHAEEVATIQLARGLAGLSILAHQLSSELFHFASHSRPQRSPHNQCQPIIVIGFLGSQESRPSSSGLDGSLHLTACELHLKHVEM